MLYDITPPVSERLCVWPGDVPPTREVLCDLRRGDAVTLSALHATAHLGAHADAPSHIGADGRAIHECPLEDYLGPCQVIRVMAARGAALTPGDLRVSVQAERVLLATGTYPDPQHFNEDFAGLGAELVEWLHAQGVRLVGVDTPSVDLFAATDLPAHRACLRCGLAILEGLALTGVPEGLYELIALPLKLVGFDGSPVRAVLRTLPVLSDSPASS